MTLATFATLPREDGREFRIEAHAVPNGPPVIALRVWSRADDGGERHPREGQGFALRGVELRDVIVGLVDAARWLHERERERRQELESEIARRRREARQ